jgi:class 3 adenylate cyclase
MIALALAALRPARVRSVVIMNGFAKFMASDNHPCGADPEFVKHVNERLFDVDHPDGPFDIVRYLAPSAADDVRFRDWWNRAGRRGASPATARALRSVIETLDVRDLLPAVDVPTLVLHRTDAALPAVQQGQYIAERVPRSRFLGLPGADAIWFVGDTEPMLDEIEGFVTGTTGTRERDRAARTVVLTDIVDSTTRASALGDREWSRLFDSYEAAAYRQVARFDGTYVKSTGDGSLAVFDGPVRAVRAAAALRADATALGVQLRIGIHTGTVEYRGDDIAGVAIHLAARVLGAARPGETLVTSSTAQLLAGADVTLEDRGTHALKGLPEPAQLYRLEGNPT